MVASKTRGTVVEGESCVTVHCAFPLQGFSLLCGKGESNYQQSCRSSALHYVQQLHFYVGFTIPPSILCKIYIFKHCFVAFWCLNLIPSLVERNSIRDGDEVCCCVRG